MIKSFGCKETQKIFCRKFSTKIDHSIQKKAKMKLDMIDASKDVNDLKVPPANRLEELKGARSHEHSIRINDQWRICFEWDNGYALNLKIEDYHK